MQLSRMYESLKNPQLMVIFSAEMCDVIKLTLRIHDYPMPRRLQIAASNMANPIKPGELQ